jgi:hypothetical protein
VAAGLAPAVLAEIASSMPIPPNIDIVVRLLLLLLLATSKNEINTFIPKLYASAIIEIWQIVEALYIGYVLKGNVVEALSIC